MKLTTFFISKTKQIYAKALTVSENTFKIKAMLPRILFKILLPSVFICKQIFARNTNTKNVNQGHFRKLLETSTNFK